MTLIKRGLDATPGCFNNNICYRTKQERLTGPRKALRDASNKDQCQDSDLISFSVNGRCFHASVLFVYLFQIIYVIPSLI